MQPVGDQPTPASGGKATEPARAARSSRREVGKSWLATAADWRNWRLRAKVGAILLLPMMATTAVGGLLIDTEVDHAGAYLVLEHLVSLRGSLNPLLAGIRQERSEAADLLVNSGMADSITFRRQAATDDSTAASVIALVNSTAGLDEAATTQYHALTGLLGGLAPLRRQVLASAIDLDAASLEYSDVNRGLLAFDQALASQFADPQLSGPATALYDLQLAHEQIGVQQAIMMAGIGRGHLLAAELSRLQESDIRWQDYVGDFNAVASDGERTDYQNTVTGPAVTARAAIEQSALSRGTGSLSGLSMPEWSRDSDATMALLNEIEDRVAAQLQGTAAQLRTATSRVVWMAVVGLVVLILVVAAISFVIVRYLLRSLRLLRRSALDVADQRLPAAVASILAGGTADAAVERVPLRTTEEFGQLARAFDRMQIQAVQLAVEQASLRDNMRGVLVNLSRRSQALVERQLHLMEQWERQEENPEQLANLFKLDHLATRMRRNNENLMVLSGVELTRRFSQTVSIADVLRAAVSETEDYWRIAVRSTPATHLVGYAAGDLVRLLAELLDNAAAFSPPDTQVVLASHEWDHGSLLVQVIDQGVGMDDEDLAAANGRVVSSGLAEVPVIRRMGLYVVGRLARRHHITVRLIRNSDSPGLRALVLVPAGLVPADQDTKVIGGLTSDDQWKPPEPTASAEGTGDAGGNEPNGHALAEIGNFVGELTHNGAVDIPASGPSRPQQSDVDDPSFGWFGATRTDRIDPLPKRVPRTNLQENLAAPPQPVDEDAQPAGRDAQRARSFLSSYQSGLAASRRDLTTESGEQAT